MEAPSNANIFADRATDASAGAGMKRDQKFFLEWEFAFIQVEDAMFRLPRQPLVQLSQTLGDLLTPGSTEVDPIVLHNVKAIEFRRFLRILYPAFLSKVDNTFEKKNHSTDEWVTILNLSTKFRCLKLRREAIRSLDSIWNATGFVNQFPTEAIQLGRSFWVPKWVLSGYTALVIREESISEKEMLEIGSVEAFRLMHLREKRTKSKGLFYVDEAIRKFFEQEIALITTKETQVS